MANPEIELPPSASSELVRDDYDDEESRSGGNISSPADDEKKSVIGDWKPSEEKQEDCLGSKYQVPTPAERPIIYKYLTFDTFVPSPVICSLSNDVRQSLPPPPDLTPYIDPLRWSVTRKTSILWLSTLSTACAAFSAGGYSPGAMQMEREWHVSNIAILVGITTFTCGFAIAPMVLAPFSEINGRKPVFIATGALFVLCQICCGVTKSYPGMLVSRFFVGVGGSTFSTMVGGIVSDIYAKADRNMAMSIFSGAALFGTGLGPFVCGFIAQHTTYRWMFYTQAIFDGVLVLAMSVFLKETRGSVLLSRKATALNKWYEALEAAGSPGQSIESEGKPGTYVTERIRWKVEADEQRASISIMIKTSLTRPFHLLFTEPILFSFSLWVSFCWAVLYLTLAGIPLVYSEVYNRSIEGQGAVFASLSAAALFFTPVTIFQEKLAYRYNWFSFRSWTSVPEHRLIFACVQSLLLPIGLFIFGWTARSSISLVLPAFGMSLATMGIFSIYLATFNYLADVYGAYASSALAAQSFCRNVAGGVLPLVTGAMFHGMGIGRASSLLGGIGVLLGIVPWILLFWGAKIRHMSPFAVSGERVKS
jgi:multidrug resistance protein